LKKKQLKKDIIYKQKFFIKKQKKINKKKITKIKTKKSTKKYLQGDDIIVVAIVASRALHSHTFWRWRGASGVAAGDWVGAELDQLPVEPVELAPRRLVDFFDLSLKHKKY
jgi:hypothetical protein